MSYAASVRLTRFFVQRYAPCLIAPILSNPSLLGIGLAQRKVRFPQMPMLPGSLHRIQDCQDFFDRLVEKGICFIIISDVKVGCPLETVGDSQSQATYNLGLWLKGFIGESDSPINIMSFTIIPAS